MLDLDIVRCQDHLIAFLDAVTLELMEPDHPMISPYRSGKILDNSNDIIIWK